MYEAYAPKTVTTGVPFDISAFEAHGSQGKVLVGNKGGQVLTFSPSRDGKYDFKMFRRFESKAIQQLKSVESHNLLICLCENQLNVHDLTEVATIVSKKPIKHSKINCFDVVVRECTQQIYLALSANRSIYIYEYKNGEFQEMDVEYQSNSQFLSDVEALTWCGTSRVAFSDSGQYKIIQVLKNEKYGEHPDNIGYIRELFEVGKKLDKPLIVDVSDFKIIGFCRNNEVVFSTYIGTQLKSKGTEPGEEPKYGNVRFSSTPKALIYDSPYLIAILENAVIEIRSLKSSMHIQTIELSKSRIQARMLCVSRPGQVLVSNSKDVWLLDSHKQLANNVNFLLAERQFDLAIQLAELGASIDPRSKANVLEIKREAAFQKFCQNNFVESFALYAEIKSEVWDVIALFSGLLSDDFRDKVLGGTRLPPDLNVNEARKGYGALARYLTLVRSEISSALENHHVRGEQLLDEDTLAHHEVSLQIIDTTLLKCYVNMNQTTLLASLLRLRDNSCKIDDSIEVLERVGMFEQLFLLYERRNLHEKALELLKNQSKNRESALWGTDRTIEYLQGLGNEHLPLIFHYASWILADNYEKGLSIFTSEDDETTRELDREEVHRFLMSECMDAVIPYLEFLIYEMDEQRPKFHEALAQSYIAKIKGMLKDYIHVLTDNDNVIRGGTEEGELGIYRKKLIRLLELSKNYSVDSVYAWLGNESFYEERAILLGVKNEHEKALYLYTSVLFDFIGAERFCVRHYDPNDEDKSQVFLKLFKAYTKPKTMKIPGLKRNLPVPKPNVKEASNILKKHAESMDAVQAIAMLPDDTLFADFWGALEGILQFVDQTANEREIHSAMSRKTLEEQEVRLREVLDKKVHVDSRTKCFICQKTIGNAAFTRNPQDGLLIHLGCSAEKDG